MKYKIEIQNDTKSIGSFYENGNVSFNEMEGDYNVGNLMDWIRYMRAIPELMDSSGIIKVEITKLE